MGFNHLKIDGKMDLIILEIFDTKNNIDLVYKVYPLIIYKITIYLKFDLI